MLFNRLHHIKMRLIFQGDFNRMESTHFSALAQRSILVLAFETSIASLFGFPSTPFQQYNFMNLTQVENLMPELKFFLYFDYLTSLGAKLENFTADVPQFYQGFSSLLSNTSVQTLKNYFLWQTVHTFAPYLSSGFVSEDFYFFSTILDGQLEMSPRWENCIQYTDQALGEVLGQYFVDLRFSGDSFDLATDMIESIEAAMKADLQEVVWMDDTTRAAALVKLSMVENQIGSPKTPLNYTGLNIGDVFFENIFLSNYWFSTFSYKQIGFPSNKNLWEMTPDTINAYYDDTKNQMVFPAGILQSPYFNASFPKSMIYGGAGVIMGHELTHGFDNSGKDYNGNGKLTNWWLPATEAKFNSLATCVIEQYSTFEILPGLNVNGNMTLPENIADMGGTKNSFNALASILGQSGLNQQSIVPGFNNAQLFFIAYAQGWCSIETPEYMRLSAATDPHSPPRYRVLGPLINHPYFASTFSCPVGSYMNPTNKCAIW
eukprot:TRINITY_DN1369_c0_g1_i3.p1 TRINITY_DN1369_c0_g1~~TRINITY_DN1369_c0_g1_i3.p1  ORF type:complete len:489 (+),score=90.78 TRINITY_DN1369_c0_g1_i3:549-2015(+)